MTRSLKACCVAALLLSACGSETSPEIELPEESRSPATASNGTSEPERVASCDGAPSGTACGEAGQRMQCIFSACVRNVCGDRVAAFGEECDDGNQRDGDGCSHVCAIEVAPGCGNDVLEPGEQCDDGNVDDDDRCTSECKIARCGDGIVSSGEGCDDGNVANGDTCSSRCQDPASLCGNGALDPGEVCDDANEVDDDACQNDCTLPDISGTGGTGGDSGSGGTGGTGADSGTGGTGGTGGDSGTGGTGGDSGTGGTGGDSGTGGTGGSAGTGPSPECVQCRNDRCQSYQGANFVLGCFDATAAGDTERTAVGIALTPTQVQSCVDAVACVDEPSSEHCAYNALNPVNPCYCGLGTTVDFCNNPGNPATGPCKAEFEAAAGTAVRSDVLLRMNDITYPTGWAYFLFECTRLRCMTECQ